MKKGKTTRLIDRCVQEFFKNGICFIYEDRFDVNTELKTHNMFTIFENRMKSEHSKIKYTYEFTQIDRIKCYKVKNNSNT